METKWILPILFILLLPAFNILHVYFMNHYVDCEEKQEAYRDLLASKHCRDLHRRLKHTNAKTVDCKLAEKQLNYKIWQCAAVSAWDNFELVHLYRRLFDSYWKMLPIILFAMYLVYSYISTRNSENRMYERMDKITQNIGYRPPATIKQQQPIQKVKIYDDSPLMEIDW